MYTGHADLERLGAGDWLESPGDACFQGWGREKKSIEADLGILEERERMFGPDSLGAYQGLDIGSHSGPKLEILTCQERWHFDLKNV